MANEPVALALLMVMAGLLGLHPESLALIDEGLVPPPVPVSGGENPTLANTEHVTEPGAGPENLGALDATAASELSTLASTVRLTLATTTVREPPNQPRRREVIFIAESASRTRSTTTAFDSCGQPPSPIGSRCDC